MFSLNAANRSTEKLIFDEVPDPVDFNVTGVCAQPDVVVLLSGFAALSPRRFVIAPTEQSGSRIDVKVIDRLKAAAVSCSVQLSVVADQRMCLNLNLNMLEDVAACYLSVV